MMRRLFPSSSDEAGPQRKKIDRHGGGPTYPNLEEHCAELPGCTASVDKEPSSAGAFAPGVATESQSWPAILRCIMSERREGLGQQCRNIRLQTGYSGIGSIGRVLTEMDIAFVEDAGVEINKSAYHFCRQNGTLPTHWFQDMEEVVRLGAGSCWQHQKHCTLPLARPDLLVSGFPCRPYSRQRPGSSCETDRADHIDFKKTQWAIQHFAKVRPHMALFENVEGFASRGPDDTAETSHLEEFCEQLRGLGYSVAWGVLDLTPWIAANSTRVYIWCVDSMLESAGSLPAGGGPAVVHTGPPLPTLAERVKALAAATQTARTGMAREPLGSIFLRPSSTAWLNNVGIQGFAGDIPSGYLGEDDPDSAWARQAQVLRERWGRAGRPESGARSWTDPTVGSRPALRGVPVPVAPRRKEILNLWFLWACYQRAVSPADPAARSVAAHDLVADTSQNPSRHPWSHGLKRFCRSSRPYVYELDRELVPVEGFRAFGWRNASLNGLTPSASWDLLGDSMALQTLAVATTSLLYVVGSRLEGTWSATSVTTGNALEAADCGGGGGPAAVALEHNSVRSRARHAVVASAPP